MVEEAHAWAFDLEGGLRLERRPLPPLRAGWARCRILRVQPSVLEALALSGRGTPAPGRDAYSYGHEFLARVLEVTTPFPADLVGRRVVCPPAVPCGKCPDCLESHPARCTSRFRLGRDTTGAFRDIIDLPGAYLIPLADRVSDIAGCCAQPAVSVVANLVHAQMWPGARVLVMGQGTMGLLILQAALAHGAAAVLTTARRQSTRDLSESLGAAASLDPSHPAAGERMMQFRPDFIVDAAGGPRAAGLAANSALDAALSIVAPYGTVLELADLDEPITLLPSIRDKSLRIIFGQSSYYYGLYPHTLSMLGDGRMKCEPFVTHEVHGLENLPQALEMKVNRAATGSIQVQLVLD